MGIRNYPDALFAGWRAEDLLGKFSAGHRLFT